MTIDEAIRALRAQPEFAELVRDAYLGPNVADSVERFVASGEFRAVRKLLGSRIQGATVVDLGAGIGMASEAFHRAGAVRVIAIEPDPSDEVGRAAMARAGVTAEIVDGVGEALPLADSSVDVVYCRQVLHHALDLKLLAREVARVLRPGGAFLAVREHVISGPGELSQFLDSHPVHRLAGGENAEMLSTYLDALTDAGLRLHRVIGPWDSVINAFPTVRTDDEIPALARTLSVAALSRRFGRVGRMASFMPGVLPLVWRRIQPAGPGRLYSFLALRS